MHLGKIQVAVGARCCCSLVNPRVSKCHDKPPRCARVAFTSLPWDGLIMALCGGRGNQRDCERAGMEVSGGWCYPLAGDCVESRQGV
jgi:hypothetical protein